MRLGESATESGLDLIAWGSLTLENTNVGALTCQALAGGDLANPVGGVVFVSDGESVAVVDDMTVVVVVGRWPTAREPRSPHAATVIARSATKQPARMRCTFA